VYSTRMQDCVYKHKIICQSNLAALGVTDKELSEIRVTIAIAIISIIIPGKSPGG